MASSQRDWRQRKETAERKKGQLERDRLLGEVARLVAVAERRAMDLETVVKSIADAAFVSDDEGCITLANGAGLRLLGLANMEEIQGCTLVKLIDLIRIRHPDGLDISRLHLGELGLYISREIVSRHGGKMWFESEDGKGSIFYFSLPLGYDDAEK